MGKCVLKMMDLCENICKMCEVSDVKFYLVFVSKVILLDFLNNSSQFQQIFLEFCVDLHS